MRKQCHGNEDLVAEVEELLAAQPATSFLQNPPNAQLQSTADLRDQQSSKLKLQGSQIGPYKIRELIGEGGMGVRLCCRTRQAAASQSRVESHQTGNGFQSSTGTLRG